MQCHCQKNLSFKGANGNNCKCIYCGFCEEACPTDAIVLPRIFEFHFEQRGEQVITKEQLLAIGDRNEEQIAADRAEDALYR